MALNKIELDGKTYILVPEEVYNETPERARTGYERVEDGNDYWLVAQNGRIDRVTDDSEYDSRLYERGNYYTDEQLAKDNARADSILRRMRQWQALNDDAVDIYNSAKCKHYIQYAAVDKQLVLARCTVTVNNHAVYFSTAEKAQEALEVFRDDLIWLHTQYRRRLDEVRG